MSSPDIASTAKRKDLRDRPLGRIAILFAVLAFAVLASRSCAGGDQEVAKDDAVETARSVVLFEPDDVQVRFLRRGLPSRPYWIVSMYKGTYRNPTVVQVVIVDAATGEITDDGIR